MGRQGIARCVLLEEVIGSSTQGLPHCARRVQAIGYDMDYTLAQYRPDTFEGLAHKVRRAARGGLRGRVQPALGARGNRAGSLAAGPSRAARAGCGVQAPQAGATSCKHTRAPAAHLYFVWCKGGGPLTCAGDGRQAGGGVPVP